MMLIMIMMMMMVMMMMMMMMILMRMMMIMLMLITSHHSTFTADTTASAAKSTFFQMAGVCLCVFGCAFACESCVLFLWLLVCVRLFLSQLLLLSFSIKIFSRSSEENTSKYPELVAEFKTYITGDGMHVTCHTSRVSCRPSLLTPCTKYFSNDT